MRLMPLIPLHQRILERLREQKSRDPHGLIGTSFLGDDAGLVAIGLTPAEAVAPLLTRQMVVEGDIVPFHIRITPFGEACLCLGLMPHSAVEQAEQPSLLQELKMLSSGARD